MAITFGNSSSDTSLGSPISYNNNGDFLAIGVSSTSNNLSAVTYGGVAMTQVGSAQLHSAFGRYLTVWTLVNPAQGANNLAFTGGANRFVMMSSISGVDQSIPYTGLNITSGTAQNPAIVVTTTEANSFPVSFGIIQNGTASAGANTTLVRELVGGSSYIHRSTNEVASASAFTINTTSSASGEYVFKGFGVNPQKSSFLLMF